MELDTASIKMFNNPVQATLQDSKPSMQQRIRALVAADKTTLQDQQSFHARFGDWPVSSRRKKRRKL